MKLSLLKAVRIFAAIVFFIPIFLYLCDFLDLIPNAFGQLTRIQLAPAILSGSVVTLVVLLLLTLLFGRIYCSVICPLGILQDFILHLSGRGRRQSKAGGNRKKRWFKYSEPQHCVRYGLLALCVVFFIFGIITPLLLLDPYSNFGRIVVNLFRPVGIEVNNLVNQVAMKAGNFSFYHISIHTASVISVVAAFIALLVTGIMSFLRGRLFCNTLCPVGSLLGLISRFSIFRMMMDESRCNQCGLCERACKSECIDSKRIQVDSSRCVSCFNCLSHCRHDAIGYRFSWIRKTAPLKANDDLVQSVSTTKNTVQTDRRQFLVTGTVVAATIPFVPAWAKGKVADDTKLVPITPPGSRSLKHFKEKCTACHLCVTHCPQQILKPAGMNFGLGFLLKPHMVYERAYCNFECDICSKVCPNGAIQPVGENKKTTQIGIARFDQERCVVHTDGTDCGACSEHCPTQAVKMLPYKDTLRLPHVTPDLCVGCGGCEYICPVRPVRAINVISNEIHQVSRKPEEEEIEHIKVDDFGF